METSACPYCGASVPPETRQCEFCGTWLVKPICEPREYIITREDREDPAWNICYSDCTDIVVTNSICMSERHPRYRALPDLSGFVNVDDLPPKTPKWMTKTLKVRERMLGFMSPVLMMLAYSIVYRLMEGMTWAT